MRIEQLMSKLFGFSTQTYFNWKKEQRPILALLSKYISKNELEEFLETGRISKLDLTNERDNIFYYAGFEYLDLFLRKSHLVGIGDIVNEKFMDLYFNILVFAKNDIAGQSVFKPFSMGKTALLYLAQNHINSVQSNTLTPSFEVGLEMLDEFDCYTNDFVQTNLLQNFAPIIRIAHHIGVDLDQKVEAYLHAILFNLYNEHQDKTTEQKRAILMDIFSVLFQAENVKHDPILFTLNVENMSLDTLFKIDFKIIEKNFDKIIQAIKAYE